MMFSTVSASFDPLRLFKLLCVVAAIDAQFAAVIGRTDDPYNDMILGSRRGYGDLPSPSSSPSSSAPVIDRCTSGLPCHVLAGPIGAMRALLDELEIASKQHCQRPLGSEVESSIKSREANAQLQGPNDKKPPFPIAPRIQNFVTPVGRPEQHEESQFSPGQLYRQLPLQPYQVPGPHRGPRLFDRPGQAYTNDPRKIVGLNQSRRLPVGHESAVDRSSDHDQFSSSDVFGGDGRRNKDGRRKLCSRRSGTGSRRIKPRQRIENDASTDESEDQTNDIISVEATSPKTETEPVTTSSEAEVGSVTETSDQP